MSALRPHEAPVLISEWLDDPQTVDTLEAILAERVDLGVAGRKPRARLAIRDDEDRWATDTSNGTRRPAFEPRMRKLHERDAAVWLIARLREQYP